MKSNKILFFLLCSFLSATAWAHVDERLNSLSGSDIQGGTIEVEAADFNDLRSGAPFSSCVEASEVQVRLTWEDKQMAYYSTGWSITVNYDVELFHLFPSQDQTLTSQSLTIDFDPTAPYTDIALKDYAGYIGAKITVNSVIPSAGINAVPNDLLLEGIVRTKRYRIMGGQPLAFTHQSYDVTNNTLGFAWTYREGAESYDLEWVFVDVADAPFATGFDFDWRDAVRINIAETHYQLNMAYPRGILVYRVRGVGRRCNSFSMLKYTEWSTAEPNLTNTNAIGQSNPIGFPPVDQKFEFDGFDSEMNWAYQMVFSENGKRGESITYADGALRARQQVAQNRADETVVAQETYYDYLGRPAASAMGAPLASQRLGFYPGLSRTSANQPFSYLNFDLDNNVFAPEGVDPNNSQGAGRYYSSANTTPLGPLGNLTPNAEDGNNGSMVYQRTLLKNDGTGRVRRSGGVGPEHHLGSTHETRYYYGTPGSQKELDRLFGNEVGWAKHYNISMMVDANGQVHITYTDAAGRTIATALAGDAPSNLLEIDLIPTSNDTITDSLDVFNDYDDDGTSYFLSNTFLVAQTSDYEFSYSLDPQQHCNDCVGCVDCKYDLFIEVIDEMGQQVPLVWNGNTVNSINTTLDMVSVLPGDLDFTAPGLTIGSYTVNKVLTLNVASQAAYVDYFLNNPDQTTPACLTEPLPANEDSPTCEDLCEENYLFVDDDGDTVYLDETGTIVAVKQPNGFFSVGSASLANDVSLLIDACKLECAPSVPTVMVDPCQLKYDRILADMSPNGQYFNNTPAQFLTSGFPNTNYNSVGIYISGDINDWLSNSILNDAANANAADFNALFNASNIDNWEDVRTNWDDNWLHNFPGTPLNPNKPGLKYYHPEYCFWETECGGCIKGEIITTYVDYHAFWDSYNQATADYYLNGAVNSNELLFNPINIPQSTNTGNPGSYQPFQLDGSTDSPDPTFICFNNERSNMRAHLMNFLPTTSAQTSFYSLWYVIEDPDDIAQSNAQPNPNGLTISPDAQNFFNQLHGDGINPGIIGSGPNQQSEFQFFRSVYRFFRDYELYQVQNDNCTRLTDATGYNQTADGYGILYPANPLFENWNGDLGLLAASQADSVCESQCEQMADTWLADLGPCIDPSKEQDIRNYLIGICQLGCGANGTGSSNGNGQGGTVNGPEGPLATFADVWNAYSIDVNDCPVAVYPVPGYSADACECDRISNFLASFYQFYGIGTGAPLSAFTTQQRNDLMDELEDIMTPLEAGTITFNTVVNWVNECDAANAITTTTPALINAFVCDDTISTAGNDPLPCDDLFNALLDWDAWQAYYNALNAAAVDYEVAYVSSCMNDLDARETFQVRYEFKEYYYTLYYYDQAGNTVKTVPPQGVYENEFELYRPNGNAATVDDVQVTRANGYTATDFIHPHYEYATKYEYNSLQQLVRQQTPDGGITRFWYDELDRLIISQNSVQAQQQSYSYQLYDELGRAVQSGEISNVPLPPADVLITNAAYANWVDAAEVDPSINKSEVSKVYYEAPASAIANAQFPNGQQNLRNRVAASAYFETYTNQSDDYDNATHYSYDIHGNANVVVTENKDLDNLAQQFKVMEYDYDLLSGNVNQVSYQKGQWDQFFHRYFYDENNRLTETETSRDGEVWEREAKHFYYAYGPMARTELGDKQVQATDYTYNVHGWLKAINSGTGRSDLDPSQDGVNGGQHQFFGQDAMGINLNYYSGDYQAIGGNNSHLAVISNADFQSKSPGLYNGNIGQAVVALTDESESAKEVMGNAYRYDQLNRIRHFNAFKDLTGTGQVRTSNAFSDVTASDNGDYASEYHYDLNGNLTDLIRNGFAANPNGQAMDDFDYSYEVNSVGRLSNRLDHVIDPTLDGNYTNDIDEQQMDNYTYDNLGQLKSDRSEHIDNITWTVDNKVKEVIRDGLPTPKGDYPSDLEFKYNASGQRNVKIEKPFDTNGNRKQQEDWIYTYYALDASGQAMAIYSRKFEASGTDHFKDHYQLEGWNVYSSKRLGQAKNDRILTGEFDASYTNSGQGLAFDLATVVPTLLPFGGTNYGSNPATYTRELGQKQYELSNHLGNVLETVADRKLAYESNPGSGVVAYYSADVLSYSDYYPFGMQMPGRNGNSGVYRYGFQGQEEDDEVSGSGNSYTAEYWQYDSRLGRRWNIDPVVKYHESPYASFANNPIWLIDPTGADTTFLFSESDGSYLGMTHLEDYGVRGAFTSSDDNPESSITSYFSFADPQNDADVIMDGNITHAIVVSESTVLDVLNNAGVNEEDNQGLVKGSKYLLNNSHNGIDDTAPLDFVSNANIPGDRSKHDGFNDEVIYVTQTTDGLVGQNSYNFGNYLWGASTTALGIPNWLAIVGANANNFFRDIENRRKALWKRKLDSKDDQYSIKLGMETYEMFYSIENE